MSQHLRLSPQEVRTNVTSGAALLVCAYDNEEKFKRNQPNGAISLSEFKSRLSDLSKDQRIIFYCA